MSFAVGVCVSRTQISFCGILHQFRGMEFDCAVSNTCVAEYNMMRSELLWPINPKVVRPSYVRIRCINRVLKDI